MKNTKILIGFICIISLLAGCRSKDVTDTPTVDSDIILNKNPITTTKPKSETDYAKDSLGINSDNKYESGIKIGDVEIEKPYNYKGNTIDGKYTEPTPEPTPEITPEPTSEIKVDDEPEVSTTPEPDLSTEDNKDKEPEVTEPNIDIPDENAIQQEYIKGKAKEIKDLIIQDTYYSGIVLLNGVVSKSKFNNEHEISMESTIKSLKSNLENIEYCDTLINETFSSDINLINNWNQIKEELISWRDNLIKVDTAEDYIKSNIKLEDSTAKSFKSLNNILIQYS